MQFKQKLKTTEYKYPWKQARIDNDQYVKLRNIAHRENATITEVVRVFLGEAITQYEQEKGVVNG